MYNVKDYIRPDIENGWTSGQPLIFGIHIPTTTRYNVISEVCKSEVKSIPKNVTMSLNNVPTVFKKCWIWYKQVYLKFCLDLCISILLIQFWYSSTSINVRLSFHFRDSLLCMLSSLFICFVLGQERRKVLGYQKLRTASSI